MDYRLFIIPLLIMVVNQAIKTLVDLLKGNFSWFSIFSYGGMPSSHAALVTSLTTVLGYYQGLNSPAFAVAIVVAVITLRDASGIRLHLGTHGLILNRLIKELPDEKEYTFPVLNEKFGHKNAEIIVGIMIGLLLTLLAIRLWP
jgi:acid phosphatase family membrane protein YuiD